MIGCRWMDGWLNLVVNGWLFCWMICWLFVVGLLWLVRWMMVVVGWIDG